MEKTQIFMSDLEAFILLLSCLFHDIDHTGKTNQFEINKMSELAIRYHDKAVLENHHAAQAFRLLSKHEFNILESFEQSQYNQIRKMMISNILATEMKEHFIMLRKLKDQFSYYGEKYINHIKSNPEDEELITNLLIHASDLNGPVKPFPIASKWSIMLSKEFTSQVRQEKALHIPVSVFMDNLDKMEVLAKGEQQFIKVIIQPLWSIVNDLYCGELEKVYSNVQDNIDGWKREEEKALKALKHKK